MKKILAALAAGAVVFSMAGASVMAEGLEDEGLELEDEVVEEVEDIEDVEDVEEDVVEETEEPVVEEVVEEAAPVEVAPSPKTGNAPIALAVIPVALAAAAVVAKKRG
ncbi:MAG: hypothetical protein IKP75_09400 [Oscillospiraceae bacterium]|nr:hypothetical protein [Oscillospiraceae bacterium]MBR4347126.1 hypothetical protein [Oscillospiraceae bacterium]